MGAAFITHFVANAIRTPEDSPLGRFSIPDGRTIGIAAIVLLVPFSAGEVAYFIGKSDSSAMGGTGDYLVEIDGSFETLHEDTEYIMNGETLTIDLHTDAISWSSENPNIVIAMVYLNYSEDETSGGPGCALPGASDSEPDTIIGVFILFDTLLNKSTSNPFLVPSLSTEVSKISPAPKSIPFFAQSRTLKPV